MGLLARVKFSSISSKDKVLFSRSLAATIEAGVPLLKAFSIVAKETSDRSLQDISERIVEKLEQGQKLSSALQKYPEVFDDVFVYSIAAAEASGKMEEVLKDLATRQEKDYEFESAIKSAVAYPSFVLAALIMVTIFLVSLVMPKIQLIIKESNIDTPALTQALIGLSIFLSKYYYIVIIAIIGFLLWLRMFLQTPSGKMFTSRLVLSLPLIREMYINIYMARFSKTMHMLMSSGVPYLNTIELTAKVIDNKVIQKILHRVSEQVERGVPMSVPLSTSNVIPPLVSQMIAVGEQTGKLEDVMKSINELYTLQSDRNIGLITSLLEPMLLMVVAIVIALVVFAIIIPIYHSTGGI